MKTSKYIAVALTVLALSSCSNDDDRIFDQSAADRLEQYKKDYAEVLTADGGLWTMEYFSNDEEPGYLFVMKFDKNGSVDIAANHKWINNQYRKETSLWKMIADNGPVLSFNSYNPVFHIFADPANITGPNAPTGENGDINETGYGHEGDYEFQFMEVSDDGQTVRLLGKKRLYDIYLRRLDPNTDVQAYMDEYKQISSSLFCEEIPNLVFNDADGEKYIINDANTGVMSIYPAAGDPVEQTRTGNFIITKSGIRFMNPLELVDSKGNEKEINEFKYVGNFSLASLDNENSIISGGTMEDIMYGNKKNWKVDIKSATGTLKDALDAFVTQLRTLYGYKSANINDLSIKYDISNKSYTMEFYIRTGSKNYETDKYFVSFSDTDSGANLTIGEACDNGSQLAYNAYTELQNLLALLSSSPLQYEAPSDCAPKQLTLSVDGGSIVISAISVSQN